MESPPLARLFGVSHISISNWLKSSQVAPLYSDTIGLVRGDRVKLTRWVRAGPYPLHAGEEVTIDEYDPTPNMVWVSCYSFRDYRIDIPVEVLQRPTEVNEYANDSR